MNFAKRDLLTLAPTRRLAVVEESARGTWGNLIGPQERFHRRVIGEDRSRSCQRPVQDSAHAPLKSRVAFYRYSRYRLSCVPLASGWLTLTAGIARATAWSLTISKQSTCPLARHFCCRSRDVRLAVIFQRHADFHLVPWKNFPATITFSSLLISSLAWPNTLDDNSATAYSCVSTR